MVVELYWQQSKHSLGSFSFEHSVPCETKKIEINLKKVYIEKVIEFFRGNL